MLPEDYTMEPRVAYFNGVGFVLFEKSRRAKNISISIGPFGGFRVAVPIRESYNSADEFANSKLGWMRKNLIKVRQIEDEYNNLTRGSSSASIEEAMQKLLQRLKTLAREHDFSYNRAYIGNQKRQWGSCSPANNISLNYKLAGLPDRLVDYVILHELVHTQIKTHGRGFWQKLDSYVGDAKAVDKKLKKYQPALACR